MTTFVGIKEADKTRECPSCQEQVPAYLFWPAPMGGVCPHCCEPLDLGNRRPPPRIEKEDVMGPRVVRHLEDVVVVLDNPRVGRDSRYQQDKLAESENPNFVITKSRGFSVYAETSIRDDPANPDGEPVFRGTLITERMRPPIYSLRVTL